MQKMESSTLESKPYTPLNTSLREIRLLNVFSSPESNIIQCRSKTFRLDNAPPYVGLSYEWGDEKDSQWVEVNNCPVLVRSNLWSFLRLRGGPDDYEWIWIDALCIDQANLAERSHQVGFMAQVFSQAVLVLAWLGPSTEQIDTGLEIFGRQQFWNQSQKDNKQVLCVAEALGHLCKRTYWTRLWVLQELVLARNIAVCIGQLSVPWTKFTTFLLDISSPRERKERSIMFNGTAREFVQPSSAFSMFKQMERDPANVTLLDRILSVPRFHCADPKDRVYALLGISKSSTTGMVLPDYTVDNVKVVQDVFLQAEVDEFYGVEPFVDFMSKVREFSAVLGVKASEVFKLNSTSAFYNLQQGCGKPTIFNKDAGIADSIFWWAVSQNHHGIQQICLPASSQAAIKTWTGSKCQNVQVTVGLTARTPDFWSAYNSTAVCPLHYATFLKGAEAVRQLLELPKIAINCCAHAQDGPDHTPLTLAALQGSEDIVDLLLRRQDVDINFRSLKDIDNSGTALMLAARRGYDAIVAKLLSRPDIDVNCFPQPRLGSLQMAVREGHEIVARQLPQRQDLQVNDRKNSSSDISLAGKTALMIGARFGHAGIVQQLLDRSDVDVNYGPDVGNATALQLAIRGGHEAIASLLLRRGELEINYRYRESGSRMFSYASYNHIWKTDGTALMMAAARGFHTVVRQLLQRSDIDVNCTADDHPEDDMTPLQLAIQNGHDSVVSMLLKRKELDINHRFVPADLYTGCTGYTALMMAAESRNEQIVRKLLQRSDIDINCRVVPRDYPHVRSFSGWPLQQSQQSRIGSPLGVRLRDLIVAKPLDESVLVAWDDQDSPVSMETLSSKLSEVHDEELRPHSREFLLVLKAAIAGKCDGLAQYLCSHAHVLTRQTRPGDFRILTAA